MGFGKGFTLCHTQHLGMYRDLEGVGIPECPSWSLNSREDQMTVSSAGVAAPIFPFTWRRCCLPWLSVDMLHCIPGVSSQGCPWESGLASSARGTWFYPGALCFPNHQDNVNVSQNPRSSTVSPRVDVLLGRHCVTSARQGLAFYRKCGFNRK